MHNFKDLDRATDVYKTEVDFGKVEVFGEYIKYLQNGHGKGKSPFFNRDPDSKHIQTVFELEWCDVILGNKVDVKLKITYKPIVAFQKNVEIFTYINCTGQTCRITLKGEAVGPLCKASTNKLLFYKTQFNEHLQSKLEITNVSSVNATYKFDQSYIEGGLFEIYPAEGTIKGKRHAYFTLKFFPKRRGIFSGKLFCLIWNSIPIVVDVVGFYGKLRNENTKEVEFKYYNVPIECSVGFGAYLNDSLLLPSSLCHPYINFGRVLHKEKNNQTQIVSVMNRMVDGIVVEWSEGTENFTITPKRISISPNSSADFECMFKTTENHNVYNHNFVAQIHWMADEVPSGIVSAVPLLAGVTAQGHSFPEKEEWMSFVKITPEVLVLQPCLPGHTSCATFKMECKGHLSIMYSLVPPKKTDLRVRPMIGTFKTFEIIAVQLIAKDMEPRVYIEEWQIIINGKEDRVTRIYIRGETSIPSIEIGSGNIVNAGYIQEGCQKDIVVPLKNTSLLNVSFSFALEFNNNFLKMHPIEGKLASNEEIEIHVTCIASNCAPTYKRLTCSLRAVDGFGAIVGTAYETEIDVVTEISYSQLCSFPSEKDFGEVPYGAKLEFEFNAFNFGETIIHFAVNQDSVDDYHFNIHPMQGEVPPNSKIKFLFDGNAQNVGHQEVIVEYEDIIETRSLKTSGKKIKLFQISFNCSMLIIQVDEIVEHNYGPLFGKHHFWDYLRIESMNKALSEISNSKTEKIEMHLPECEMGNKTYYVKIALKNITNAQGEIKIKRKQMCQCQLKEVADATFHLRRKNYDCPHREVVNVEISSNKFYEKAPQLLTITVKNSLPNETRMCYTLELCNRKKIELHFTIFAIPPEATRLSSYSCDFKMFLKSIFIGTRVAPIQIFWLYNNTKKLITYEIEREEFGRICRLDGFSVMDCVKYQGQVLPYSREPLMIRFHPIEAKVYKVSTTLSYRYAEESAISENFAVEGIGYLEAKKETENNMPLTSNSTFTIDFPVTVSRNSIEYKIIPIWNASKEIIFIKNNSRRDTFQYFWGKAKIDDVVEVDVERSYGILKPKELHPLLIRIKTQNEPCITNLLLPYEIINYTKLIMHQKAQEKYQEMQMRIKNEFTITDNKVEKPKNPINVPQKPEAFETTINLNINIVHTEDMDSFLSATDQSSFAPVQLQIEKPLYAPIRFNKDHTALVSFENNSIFSQVLEEIITKISSDTNALLF
ncbi:cilia- and flagella-associated protein 65-like [Cylas formicarius]|uniref:cilia- and flagella-associated protein 65-like n=1 Tax=Cylas formicarius TaxID=197179 RepID=UPI002958C646|nr:cilia- and flagella-associated protein 65-like [Cylas formicarius]